MPKTLYVLLKRKCEPNKRILIPHTKIRIKPVSIFEDTAHLYANLKVNMKSEQPYRLNAIVPTGAKRH